eukprot:483284-Amphidinium_carterae.1
MAKKSPLRDSTPLVEDCDLTNMMSPNTIVVDAAAMVYLGVFSLLSTNVNKMHHVGFNNTNAATLALAVVRTAKFHNTHVAPSQKEARKKCHPILRQSVMNACGPPRYHVRPTDITTDFVKYL